MDAKTLEALKGSISKWENIADGSGVDFGSINCPLCSLFGDDDYCVGCPVAEYSGEEECMGTPYSEWENLFDVAPTKGLVADTKERVAAANKELEFLRSLLPPESEFEK